MDIVVFGAGSLGSLIGGLLARQHGVTLVGRDPHIETVRESGLEIGGEFDLTTYPDARTDVSSLPSGADLGVVTVKAFDTETAARALSGRVDVALSLQNGMGNEEVLQAELDRVLAGTCTYGAVLREPARVECTGRGEVVLGPFTVDGSGDDERIDHTDCTDHTDGDAAEQVGRAFERAGIDVTVAGDVRKRLWEKLAVNAGINPATALARVPNGALRTGDARDLATRATRETARVARAQGIDLPDERALAALEEVVGTTAANESSMLQDVRNERRTEIDAISGYVVDRAAEPILVTETLRDLVRAWERGHDLR